MIRLLFLSLVLAATPSAQPTLPLIPLPASVDVRGGTFAFSTDTRLVVATPDDDEAERVAEMLADWLGGEGEKRPRVSVATDAPDSSIVLIRDASIVGDEAYVLDVSPSRVELRASTGAGLFYAAQTLRQLFPPQVERAALRYRTFDIPSVRVEDAPRFGWRGMMLDVARHFFGVADVKQMIDLAARYKLNMLHLHLTDDQGWRIEIPGWPLLTSVGGATQVGGGPGGFYTLADYDEIVRYAAERYVTVVPEIDVPGHVNAAAVAYPFLSCADEPPTPYTGIQVGFSALCTDDERTYEWLADAVRTLARHTPGPYLHLGGDEAHATDETAYVAFMDRAQRIVADNGKQMIGWDDIAKVPDLLPGTVAQVWRAQIAQTRARVAGSSATVVLSPSTNAYLDMKYDAETSIGLDWAGTTTVEQAYDWNPESLIEDLPLDRLLGIEAPLWTETVATFDDATFLVLPRLPALAEVGWTAPGQREWSGFRSRLASHGAIWTSAGLTFYRSPLVDWPIAR